MKNILSVDWEDWYQGNEFIGMERANEFQHRIDYETTTLLRLFKKCKVKATFFVLGHEAEKNPQLIKAIANAGHEIASHGYSHRRFYGMNKNEALRELSRTEEIVKKITGKKIKGFRASNWSINKSTWWLLDILKKRGYQYDSSIFPTKNYSYGVPNAPRLPYQHKNELWEIPPSTTTVFGRGIPYSGGFYLRLWPEMVIKAFINEANRKNNVVVSYIHPWELDNKQPKKLPIPWLVNVLHYWNLDKTTGKLTNILAEYSWGTIADYLREAKGVRI
jgi:polysaccharide deacetylase family protein (PEP-CTERM system associated)